jgi:hypothetical protein
MLVGADGGVVLNAISGDGIDFIPIALTEATSSTRLALSGTVIKAEFVPVTVTTLVLLALERP